MIAYDSGEYHLGFIWQTDGSTLPKAAIFAVPSTILALLCRLALNYSEIDVESVRPGSTLVWTVTFWTLGMLMSFRCNKAYARFWEGCELVQAMSAEWFESASNLIAFSVVPIKTNPGDKEKENKVKSFQFRLVHLMSLLHGMALRQIGGEDGEDIEILDIFGVDEASLDYLTNTCAEMEINRVEVILHWIQVLITESIYEGVLILPPPILTRSYQTLSRGMVNLHNVRRIADIPFPFPLSQALVVLLLVHSILTPIVISLFFVSYFWVGFVTFLPLMGMWSVIFICGEMEQPFGNDDNDLPLTMQQFDFHTSLMMLVDERSMAVPTLREGAATTVELLRERFGNEESNTSVLYPEDIEERDTVRQALKSSHAQTSERRATLGRGDTKDLSKAMEELSKSPEASVELGKSRSGSKLTTLEEERAGSKSSKQPAARPSQQGKRPTKLMQQRQASKNSARSNEDKKSTTPEPAPISNGPQPAADALLPEEQLPRSKMMANDTTKTQMLLEVSRSRSHEHTVGPVPPRVRDQQRTRSWPDLDTMDNPPAAKEGGGSSQGLADVSGLRTIMEDRSADETPTVHEAAKSILINVSAGRGGNCGDARPLPTSGGVPFPDVRPHSAVPNGSPGLADCGPGGSGKGPGGMGGGGGGATGGATSNSGASANGRVPMASMLRQAGSGPP